MAVYHPSAVSVLESADHPKRRSGDFTPSMWKEHLPALFSNRFNKDKFSQQEQEHEQLKEAVRKMITEITTGGGTLERKLDLVDTIQCLGVSYHFESEIEALIPSILGEEDGYGVDLHVAALRFRLLRQIGHYVSCDVFNKFKDEDGAFKEALVGDVRGLLSLYEAANYRVHNEDVLEEALSFTTSQLVSILPNLDSFWAPRVEQALDLPIQKMLNRLEARRSIPIYEQHISHNSVLLKFAKLDFNILQSQHQAELTIVAEWWESLDCPNNFPFTRDRMVECYFWVLGVYFEPKYSLARVSLTKVICMISIMDDIYDTYGFLHELIPFTDSIQRWHISELDKLPLYMKHYYHALLNIYSEIEERLAKAGKSNLVEYAISSMKSLAKAYLQDAKWIHSGHLPNFEEYMKIALVTSANDVIATSALAGMGEFMTEDALEWTAKGPLILRACELVTRLMDDMLDWEWKKERGESASAVECYMRQYGITKEEIFVKFEKQLENAWKDTNAECLHPTSVVPKFVLERILNLTKIMHILFRDTDGYTTPSSQIKATIASVLFTSVPM